MYIHRPWSLDCGWSRLKVCLDFDSGSFLSRGSGGILQTIIIWGRHWRTRSRQSWSKVKFERKKSTSRNGGYHNRTLKQRTIVCQSLRTTMTLLSAPKDTRYAARRILYAAIPMFRAHDKKRLPSKYPLKSRTFSRLKQSIGHASGKPCCEDGTWRCSSFKYWFQIT